MIELLDRYSDKKIYVFKNRSACRGGEFNEKSNGTGYKDYPIDTFVGVHFVLLQIDLIGIYQAGSITQK